MFKEHDFLWSSSVSVSARSSPLSLFHSFNNGFVRVNEPNLFWYSSPSSNFVLADPPRMRPLRRIKEEMGDKLLHHSWNALWEYSISSLRSLEGWWDNPREVHTVKWTREGIEKAAEEERGRSQSHFSSLYGQSLQKRAEAKPLIPLQKLDLSSLLVLVQVLRSGKHWHSCIASNMFHCFLS